MCGRQVSGPLKMYLVDFPGTKMISDDFRLDNTIEEGKWEKMVKFWASAGLLDHKA